MKTTKKILIGTFFLFAIIFSLDFSNAFTISNPQFTAPGANSFNYLSKQGVNAFPIFNSNQCGAGQDFVIQVAPFGCTPAVVRSDLLEEQNVPVFCQLYATKINPLISVDAIDSISFSGNYPQAISGIGFHPARAAVRSSPSTLLNSPVIQNIGYAVIVLKQNQNESSMPDFVSGNLTANIRYDIQNAFGVGAATQYLPELNSQQWDEKFAQYSFWSGRGFLRAEGVTNDGAVVSIYSDKENKVSTFNMKKGDTSGDVYLPGLYCQAGLRLRLDDVTSPNTMVKLDINGEIVEVVEGEQFLDNQCSAGRITKKGIFKETEISCRTDTGFERFTLKVNPTIILEIDGENKIVNLGDRLYEDSEKSRSVYLAYIGTKGDTSNSNDLFAYLMESPQHKDNLTNDELESAKFLINNLIGRRITGGKLADAGANIGTKYIGIANLIKQRILDGKEIERINFKEDGSEVGAKLVFGKNVKVGGFAEPTNLPFGDAAAKTYYENSMKDYNEIISKFSNEKEDPLTGMPVLRNENSTFGKDALENAISLSLKTQQKKTATDLCKTFKEKYPSSYKEIESDCGNYQVSSNEVASKGVVINGRVKIISLREISEPTQEEFSAEIMIRKSSGIAETYILTRNEILPLNENPEYLFKYFIASRTDPITGPIQGLNPKELYFIHFGFAGGKWQWSADNGISWMDVTESKVTKSTSKIYLNVALTGQSQELLNQLKEKDYAEGSRILVENFRATREYSEGGNDFIQLVDLTENSARIRTSIRGTAGLFSDTLTLNRNIGIGTAGGGYVFTLLNSNLKKVAKVSVLPNVRNTGTSANLSFTVGIEKRGIKLSPDQIKDRIDSLNHTIADWEKNSEQLGKVVKGFNAACLTVGTTLTIKNLFENFDGRAIARTEVMRSPGGWMNICKDKVNNKEFSTIDACLLKNSDQIDRDVDLVEGVIKKQSKQGGVTKDTVEVKLAEIKNNLGTQITDAEGKNPINIADISSAFTKKGYDDGRISLSQTRDIERLKAILGDSGTSPELQKLAQGKLYKIMSDINANSANYNSYTSTQDELTKAGFGSIGVNVNAQKDAVEGRYLGGLLLKNQIRGADDLVGNEKTTFSSEIAIYNNKKYLLILEGSGSSTYSINKVYEYNGISDGKIDLTNATPQDESLVRRSYSKFTKYDSATYENKFKDPKVSYFETEPYKGLPAIVPFDTARGWYVATKQTVSGLGNIKAYDDSGRLNSFYLCNVGKNGRDEFYSDFGDDKCRSFNPGSGQIQGTFEGLNEKQTSDLVSRATRAVEDASRAYKNGISGKRVNVLGENLEVGSPSTGTPNVQCQDFMSPEECLLLFNACDPVVCPSSRCNLGGAYTVPNVIQSGIIGSAALCLPNARENIVVPVCLSGIKAGMDGFISVEKNYRDCLQTNLETGQTVGICDEIHSIYLCDFFWSQAQPLAGIIVPKIFESITGQTGRGGGEYLGVASAWANADKSVQYMTNYYGAASFEAFRTGVIKEVGSAVCKNFVSASYPSKMNFFDSLIEPESPPQYTSWFSESPYTTVTVPPTSRYKVFYHVFAGKNSGQAGRNSGAFYNIYLRTPQTGSFYSYAPTVAVASGFIPPGEFASETKDFTAPSGYKELCVSVNGQEECGFKQVTTDFGLDYVQDLYKKDVAEKTDVNSEKDCVSGTPSLYSFVNPNLQAGAQEFVDPSLSLSQIVRICSTDNPGKGTDPLAGTANGKWLQVGTCDEGKGTLKCYLDTASVKTAIKSASVENATLKEITEKTLDGLIKEGQYFRDFNEEVEKINKFDNKGKISYITSDKIAKAFWNHQKAKLIFTRAKAYAELALGLKDAGTSTITSQCVNGKNPFGQGCTNVNDASSGTAGGGTQSGLPKGVEFNPAAGRGQNLLSSLESALSELDLILKNGQADFLQYTNVNPNSVEFSKFVDKIYNNGVINSEEYSQLLEGIGNSRNLKTLLENKLNAERQTIKSGEQCIKDAAWVSDLRGIKIDSSKSISPENILIKIDVKSFDACKGYNLVIYNPDILGSDVGYRLDQIDYFLVVKELNEYYIQIKADVIKKSAVNYDDNKYKFDIYSPGNQKVFSSNIVTVSTWYSF